MHPIIIVSTVADWLGWLVELCGVPFGFDTEMQSPKLVLGGVSKGRDWRLEFQMWSVTRSCCIFDALLDIF